MTRSAKNPVVRALISNPNRSLKRHEDKRSKRDYLEKLYDEGVIVQNTEEAPTKITYTFYIKTFSEDAPGDTTETVVWRGLTLKQARDMHAWTERRTPTNVHKFGWYESRKGEKH